MTQRSTRRLRILVLAPFAPGARVAHGGGRAIANLLDGLAGRHDLAVLYLRAPDEPAMDEALAERCALIGEVRRPLPDGLVGRARRRARLVAGLARRRPSWATDFTVQEYAAQVQRVCEEWRPDIVQVEFQVMVQYARMRCTAALHRVLTVHEPAAHTAGEAMARAGGWRQLLSRAEHRAWQHYERCALDAMDVTVALTERDRSALRALESTTRLVCIPLGTELPEAPLGPLGEAPPRLIYVGSYAHPPNVDGALRLITGIFPRVIERHPDAHLDIVGPEPPAAINAHDGGCIRVTGRVPDVRPYLDAAAVVVVPLRQGGGMRVKVLEALASGKAMVASPLAVEGLDVADGKHVLIAETDAQFAAAVVRLLDDPTARETLAVSARDWAKRHLAPHQAALDYDILYQGLMATPAAS